VATKIIETNYMEMFRSFRTIVSALSLAGLVAACGSTPPPLKATVQAWPDAIDVFEAGYRGISEKYIEYISVERLALDGVMGFSAIDPALHVRKSENSITLSYTDQRILSVDLPKSNDIHEWAKLTFDLAIAARAYSADMKVADAEKIYEAVFDGVLSKLDLYSRYAGAEDARKNRAQRDGFGGIGIGFKRIDGVLRITRIIPDTPAAKSGLLINDTITHIGKKPASHLTPRQATLLIRVPLHTTVSLSVTRTGITAPQTYKLTSKQIVFPTVTEKRLKNVLYYKISSFNQGTAPSLSEKLKLTTSAMGHDLKGVVLDLRGNPGGLLKQSVKVADLFLTQGTIISTKGRHPDSLHHYAAGGSDLAEKRPLIVLIDGKSASAAEIVAAALQDQERAILIGTSSYGKGTVQSVLRLPNDGEITLTWSQFIAPSGYILHSLGVRPSMCIKAKPEPIEKLIDITLNSVSEIKSTFDQWRSMGLKNSTRRNNLRSTCPAQQRESDKELDIAKHMIENPTTYTRVLSLSSATNQAQK
jgi:carboxyl-terminal processing protease